MEGESMKISTFITSLLIVSVFLAVMISMVSEGEQKYGTEINKSEWEGQYDFVEDINDSISPIRESILTVEGGQAGFLDIVAEGFTGIVAAITFFPRMLISVSVLGSDLIVGLGSAFGLPSYITLALIVALVIWGVFKLVEAFHRWQL